MKRAINLIGIALAGILAGALLLCGFAVADQNLRAGGFADNPPIAGVTINWTAMRGTITLFGSSLELSLDGLNEAAGLGQQLSCLLPAEARLGAKLAALGIRELERTMNPALG